MYTAPILVAGEWRQAAECGRFQPLNPTTRTPIELYFPVSSWSDCDAALEHAAQAAHALKQLPGESRAVFLERYADKIESAALEICQIAHEETGLPLEPRLLNVELPRTTNQLRQAAAAARTGGWAQATLDTSANIRTLRAPIGPVIVFGPNNFPLAFNGIAGGDFAAAIAAGNPVIAKAHSAHPHTCQKLARLAFAALQEAGLPAATVQMLYGTAREDGLRLVSDQRTGASAFTGSQSAGLALKKAADEAGKPIYLELSSINPVLILKGALEQRGPAIAEEFATSCLMGTGQFCTNPGLVILPKGDTADTFVRQCAALFDEAPVGTLLNKGTEDSLKRAVRQLQDTGAECLTAANTADPNRCCQPNTLLIADGQQFLQNPHGFQTEAFGNAALLIISSSTVETRQILERLEGNLTGCFYTAADGTDDADYEQLEPVMRNKVGRLLNDKMPTGVAVSPAMNHGGPYPASGHPGFTAVGIPASLQRFSKLECYDNVRPHRLPPLLQDKNPCEAWRLVDGNWTQGDVTHL
ncbi:aldehyde dehydrogenase (NADP(+)) [Microbulbifer sp. SA54]|uniref:aldehyde dehydrogenase (NADP(+)) n=1 Tax=Microbulbifer sp. SA54 TaxID=3401577 RepID=UPI003AAC2024